MDRRLFLRGVLGAAAAAAAVSVLKPVEAMAMPGGRGILDDLKDLEADAGLPDAEVQKVWHYGYPHRRPRRPRYAWRRVCRRYYSYGRWRTRCFRRRVRVW